MIFVTPATRSVALLTKTSQRPSGVIAGEQVRGFTLEGDVAAVGRNDRGDGMAVAAAESGPIHTDQCRGVVRAVAEKNVEILAVVVVRHEIIGGAKKKDEATIRADN